MRLAFAWQDAKDRADARRAQVNAQTVGVPTRAVAEP